MKLIYVKTWSGNEVYFCEKNYEISIPETLNGKWNLCIREIIKLVHGETTKKTYHTILQDPTLKMIGDHTI